MSESDALMQLIEGYYGAYADVPVLRREVKEWIREAYIPARLTKRFFRTVTRTISREYSNRPDVVQLERTLKTMHDEIRLESPAPKLLDTGPVIPREEAARRMSEMLVMVTNNDRRTELLRQAQETARDTRDQ